MRIGVDFDNTLVNYDSVFYEVAVERNLIPPSVARNKLAVRDYLRSVGREDVWTEMQGFVYGARMHQASLFPGAFEFLTFARIVRMPLAIVSHKTQFPFLGHRYDMHESARNWIAHYLIHESKALISEVYLEETKAAKLARISSLQLDYFIDDLPEILLDQAFPTRTKPVLFDPQDKPWEDENVMRFSSWSAIQDHIQQVRCWHT